MPYRWRNLWHQGLAKCEKESNWFHVSNAIPIKTELFHIIFFVCVQSGGLGLNIGEKHGTNCLIIYGGKIESETSNWNWTGLTNMSNAFSSPVNLSPNHTMG